MEVISRANIYKKIELAKEFLKNVASCQDTVAVLDNVQSALEEEPVFNMDDEEAQNCLAVKKCSCGGMLVIGDIQIYNSDTRYDRTFTVTFNCTKCGRRYLAIKGTSLDKIVKDWNSEYADNRIEEE